MTPDLLQIVITALPNIAIAVWCIRNYQMTIDKLLANQQALIEQLMSLHPPQDQNSQPPTPQVNRKTD